MNLPVITDAMMQEVRRAGRPYTALILEAGPNRGMPGVEAIIWEHGRRNIALRAAGLLSIVCPLTDGGEICGLGIFDAEVEAVREIMDGDPGVQAGVFTYHVHPCRSFPGDALPAAKAPAG
jgi:hypothetical protein